MLARSHEQTSEQRRRADNINYLSVFFLSVRLFSLSLSLSISHSLFLRNVVGLEGGGRDFLRQFKKKKIISITCRKKFESRMFLKIRVIPRNVNVFNSSLLYYYKITLKKQSVPLCSELLLIFMKNSFLHKRL